MHKHVVTNIMITFWLMSPNAQLYLRILWNTDSSVFNLLEAKIIDQFYATVLSLYSLKASEKLWFADAFTGCRKRTVI